MSGRPRRSPLALGVLLAGVFGGAALFAPGPGSFLPSAAFGGVGVAHAQPESVPCEVLVILASELPGVVDPRLEEIPALRAAPFDRFESLTLLSSPQVELTRGRPTELRLPNGRALRLELVEEEARGRWRVRVSINRPGREDYLPMAEVRASRRAPAFFAGQGYRAGTLVIGLRVG